MSQTVVDGHIDKIKRLPRQKQQAIVDGITEELQRPTVLRTRRPKGSKPVFWHKKLVYVLPNNYLDKPQEVWRLDAILNAPKITRALNRSNILDSSAIEKLFARAAFEFYTNASETHLLSVRNELTEADFGPLQPVKAIDALKRFGLAQLEAAKEKSYVRLKQ